MTISRNSDGSITVGEARGLTGVKPVPPDKSISHRAIIFGSIASGITTVDNFLEGEDNLSTLKAFKQMGVVITHNHKAGDWSGLLRIHGMGAYSLKKPASVIDAGNSGTTARLLTGLLSAQLFSSVITGDASLRKRPMRRVVEPLRLMGAQITGEKNGELLPLNIAGGRLKGIRYKTPIASAQLKSALLIAGLFADGETTVEEPALSRDHTERMLKALGADIKVDGLRVTVTSKKELQAFPIVVPGDISSAAFFMVGAMITSKSDLLLKGVGVNPTRTGIIDILTKMDGSITRLNERLVWGEPVADIRVKTSSLNGVDINGSELLPAIDEFPIICIAAAFANGDTTISGAGELRVKESDRIAVMANSLRAIGIECHEKEDGIIIEGNGGKNIKGGTIDSLGDHRIAMAFAIAGLRATDGITIKNPDCATVSFPGFYDLLEKISQ